jgi:hypothetical protein
MRAHGGMTLDEADWTKAARLFAEGLSLRQLGERFGVSSTTIGHGLAKRRKTCAASPITITSATSTEISNAPKSCINRGGNDPFGRRGWELTSVVLTFGVTHAADVPLNPEGGGRTREATHYLWRLRRLESELLGNGWR